MIAARQKLFYMAIMKTKILLGALVLCALGVSGARAQSAVVFVPSTDTIESGKVVVGGDLYSHFSRYRNGGLIAVGPTFGYGLTKNIEVGANAYAARAEGGWTGEFQPNIKWRAVDQDKFGINLSLGAIGYVPIKDNSQKAAAKLYVNASRSFESAKNARLTGGVYRIAGGGDSFGDKTGALVAFEQPVTGKLTFVADWTSGRNKLGYSSAGFNYKMGQQDLIVAYAFGNTGRGNNYLSLLYSFTF